MPAYHAYAFIHVWSLRVYITNSLLLSVWTFPVATTSSAACGVWQFEALPYLHTECSHVYLKVRESLVIPGKLFETGLRSVGWRDDTLKM
jgi:hypothetical protein